MTIRKSVLLIGMLLLSGCVLENYERFGEPCADFSYIEEEDGRCARNSCSRGNVFFEAEMCPESHPYCIEIPNEETYCASECPKDKTHVLKQEDLENPKLVHHCEADTVEHCGPMRDNCTLLQGWIKGRCSQDKKCVAKKCADAYKVDDGVCKAYSMCCGVFCAHCLDVKNQESGGFWFCSGMKDSDDCVEMCDQGKISCDGLCVDPNTDNTFCGANAQCKGYRSCAEGYTCTNGKCVHS